MGAGTESLCCWGDQTSLLSIVVALVWTSFVAQKLPQNTNFEKKFRPFWTPFLTTWTWHFFAPLSRKHNSKIFLRGGRLTGEFVWQGGANAMQLATTGDCKRVALMHRCEFAHWTRKKAACRPCHRASKSLPCKFCRTPFVRHTRDHWHR